MNYIANIKSIALAGLAASLMAGTALAADYTLSVNTALATTDPLYKGLEAETGVATGLRQGGSVSAALTDERLEELYRQAAMARDALGERELAAELRRQANSVEDSLR